MTEWEIGFLYPNGIRFVEWLLEMEFFFFLAVDLLEKVIPRLWIQQLWESEAQFVNDYLIGGRAINGRYLDIW